MTNTRRLREGFGPDGPLRPWLLVVPVLLAMIALVHPEAFFQGDIYGSSDAGNAAAFEAVGDAALADGDYPLWNPYIFTGMPTFGSFAYTRFLYPPAELLTRLQDDLGFPLSTWMFAHLLFGGLGVVWLLGRWNLPWSARLLGAAVWVMSPKIAAWAVHGHGSKLMTAMYLPWVAGLTLETLRGRGRRAAPALALLLGLQVLSRHPQILYYTLLTVGVLILARWIAALAARPRGALPWRETAGVGLAIVLAFALGAVLLWPAHEYAAWSVRGVAAAGGGADYEFATGWSLSPRELGTLVSPSLAGFGQATYQGLMLFTDYPNYLGLLAVVLALVGLGHRERWLVRSLLAVAVLAILVSFGKHFPILYDPLYRWLPYFNKFRVPSMVLILTGFVTAVLAAVGAARLATGDLLDRSRARLVVLAAGATGIVLVISGAGAGEGLHASQLTSLAAAAGRPEPSPTILRLAWRLQSADLIRAGLLLATAAAAVLAALRIPAFRARGLVWVLLALVAVDLAGVDARVVHPERDLKQVARDARGTPVLVDSPRLLQPGARHAESIAPDPDLAVLAERLAHERAWPLGRDGAANAGMTAGLRSLGGYHPAKLAAYETIRGRLLDSRRPAGRVASWLAARLLVLDGRLPEDSLEALAAFGLDLEPTPIVSGSRVAYTNRAALPRARLVHDWLPAEGDLAGYLDALQEDRARPMERVRLDRPPEPAPRPAEEPPPAVTWRVDGLDEIVLHAEPATPAVLVLADMWMPGWSVAVDGEPAELLVADHALRAVALSAGPHEVRFAYTDPSVKQGLTVSAAGGFLILLALVFGAGFVVPRRDAAPDDPA